MAEAVARGAPPVRGKRVAFVFSSRMSYPPDIHNRKVYYVSQEMKRRGVEIDWLQVGGHEKSWYDDGIRFAVLSVPEGAHIPDVIRILRLILYCVTRKVRLVYLDEWLFLRRRPMERLLGQMMLRRLGIKLVLDQRDPYVDFEIASGELREGTSGYKWRSLLRLLLIRQADLVILPSEAYSALYQSEGVPKEEILGIFRGIDQGLFKPLLGSSETRSSLGLDRSFVIGWFGLMHDFRMIREVIVPLIENLSKEIPGAHILIGGDGPLLKIFKKLEGSSAHVSFTLLGSVRYESLPSYITACDVTICPVNPKLRLSKYSNWLKIAESIAVGTPVVATRTKTSGMDFRGVRGIIWVDGDYQSFLFSLSEMQKRPGPLQAEARDQARQFEAFSVAHTIPRIVDRALDLIRQ